MYWSEKIVTREQAAQAAFEMAFNGLVKGGLDEMRRQIDVALKCHEGAIRAGHFDGSAS